MRGEPLPVLPRRDHVLLVVVDEQLRPFVVGRAAHARGERETAFELAAKRGRRIQAGQHVEHVAVLVEDVVRAVAGGGALERAAIAVVDRHARHRPLARPVEDEALAQKPADVLVGVERGAEQPAVRARQILVEPAEHAQVKNRPSVLRARRPWPTRDPCASTAARPSRTSGARPRRSARRACPWRDRPARDRSARTARRALPGAGAPSADERDR